MNKNKIENNKGITPFVILKNQKEELKRKRNKLLNRNNNSTFNSNDILSISSSLRETKKIIKISKLSLKNKNEKFDYKKSIKLIKIKKQDLNDINKKQKNVLNNFQNDFTLRNFIINKKSVSNFGTQCRKKFDPTGKLKNFHKETKKEEIENIGFNKIHILYDLNKGIPVKNIILKDTYNEDKNKRNIKNKNIINLKINKSKSFCFPPISLKKIRQSEKTNTKDDISNISLSNYNLNDRTLNSQKLSNIQSKENIFILDNTIN